MARPEDYSEDWTKVSSWDVRNPNGTLVTTLEDLVHALPGTWPDPYPALKHFTTLPAWEAAPQELKAEFDTYERDRGEV
jgi:hypothetical protein